MLAKLAEVVPLSRSGTPVLSCMAQLLISSDQLDPKQCPQKQHSKLQQQHRTWPAKLLVIFTAQQQSGAKTSLSTTTCYLRKQGLQHLRPRTVPILTAKDKSARLAFTKEVRSSFQLVLITNSKFQIGSYGKTSRQVVHSSYKRHSGRIKAQ